MLMSEASETMQVCTCRRRSSVTTLATFHPSPPSPNQTIMNRTLLLDDV
jgi:hypothetical protein